MYEEKENLIKKQRLAEATDKNYLGLEGKFGVILKFIGVPIRGEGGGNYLTDEGGGILLPTQMSTQLYEDIDDEYVMSAEDVNMTTIGMLYNGLQSGFHLEIKYLYGIVVEFDSVTELSVYYKGHLVYQEINGDLTTFTPFKEWQDIIERLYSRAAKIKKNKMVEIKEEEKVEFNELKLSFLDRLKKRWGI